MLATIDLHVHESCMRVAVRVLHSCAFIIIVVSMSVVLVVNMLFTTAIVQACCDIFFRVCCTIIHMQLGC